MTLLTNHRGVITIPPIRNEGQILTLLKSYWCSTISRSRLPEVCFPSQETEKKASVTQGTCQSSSYGDQLTSLSFSDEVSDGALKKWSTLVGENTPIVKVKVKRNITEQ